MPSKEEIETCKEELNNYIEFMETAGDNAGWARYLKWYIEQLEHKIQVKDEAIKEQGQVIKDMCSEKKEVIDYLKEEIDTMGSGKGMFLVKTALGAVLEKIMKGEKKHESND